MGGTCAGDALRRDVLQPQQRHQRAHDEGRETLTFRLSNASGARIVQAQASGSIWNEGPLQRQWLSRFGRAVAGQMVEALEGRFAMGPGTASHLTIAGHRVDFSGAPAERWRDDGTHALTGGLTGTPYVGLGLGEHRDYRLGWRLAPAGGAGSFALSFEALRREAAADLGGSGSGAAAHELGLRLNARF